MKEKTTHKIQYLFNRNWFEWIDYEICKDKDSFVKRIKNLREMHSNHKFRLIKVTAEVLDV